MEFVWHQDVRLLRYRVSWCELANRSSYFKRLSLSYRRSVDDEAERLAYRVVVMPSIWADLEVNDYTSNRMTRGRFLGAARPFFIRFVAAVRSNSKRSV